MTHRPHFDAALDAHMACDAGLTAYLVDPRPHHRLAVITAAKRIITELMHDATIANTPAPSARKEVK